MLLFQRTQDQYPVSTKYLTTTCTQVSETLTLPSGIHKYCMYVVHRHTCRQEANTHKMYLKRIILNQNIYKGCLLDIHETLSSIPRTSPPSPKFIYLFLGMKYYVFLEISSSRTEFGLCDSIIIYCHLLFLVFQATYLQSIHSHSTWDFIEDSLFTSGVCVQHCI